MPLSESAVKFNSIGGKQVEDDEDDDILENKTQPSQAAPTPQMARQEQLSFKRERGEVLPLFMASHVGARARPLEM